VKYTSQLCRSTVCVNTCFGSYRELETLKLRRTLLDALAPLFETTVTETKEQQQRPQLRESIREPDPLRMPGRGGGVPVGGGRVPFGGYGDAEGGCIWTRLVRSLGDVHFQAAGLSIHMAYQGVSGMFDEYSHLKFGNPFEEAVA
jgi:hypothetical protein